MYQVEYSRSLLFADGARMQRLFDTVVDRTRSRMTLPKLRTLFRREKPPPPRPGRWTTPVGSRDRDT